MPINECVVGLHWLTQWNNGRKLILSYRTQIQKQIETASMRMHQLRNQFVNIFVQTMSEMPICMNVLYIRRKLSHFMIMFQASTFFATTSFSSYVSEIFSTQNSSSIYTEPANKEGYQKKINWWWNQIRLTSCKQTMHNF